MQYHISKKGYFLGFPWGFFITIISILSAIYVTIYYLNTINLTYAVIAKNLIIIAGITLLILNKNKLIEYARSTR